MSRNGEAKSKINQSEQNSTEPSRLQQTIAHEPETRPQDLPHWMTKVRNAGPDRCGPRMRLLALSLLFCVPPFQYKNQQTKFISKLCALHKI
ncbi:LOW QUALITY PROTEIN: uncharacterized protein Dsimw501_GD28533 [Drosophila simulans]|uniref:Uncharacterized protein n=1 Tax=Drosophila simulans TaxID=7240 RepID=A0A0J9RKQ1_DROSI|nr:LOW QUALITY PROTEIN: uncharacterized protein Dsimw501_GD28533 [Drosophila simulans]